MSFDKDINYYGGQFAGAGNNNAGGAGGAGGGNVINTDNGAGKGDKPEPPPPSLTQYTTYNTGYPPYNSSSSSSPDPPLLCQPYFPPPKPQPPPQYGYGFVAGGGGQPHTHMSLGWLAVAAAGGAAVYGVYQHRARKHRDHERCGGRGCCGCYTHGKCVCDHQHRSHSKHSSTVLHLHDGGSLVVINKQQQHEHRCHLGAKPRVIVLE